MKRIYILYTLSLLFISSSISAQIKIGNYAFKDGSVYTGELKGKKPNGKGKTVFKNGNVYEGEYIKGKREGHGVFTFPDGERYDGNWYQDQQHGKGTYSRTITATKVCGTPITNKDKVPCTIITVISIQETGYKINGKGTVRILGKTEQPM